jgi:tRNA pseudouridine55 synthase
MDGIINFNKPIGVTSAKALYKVRSITGQRKSGHAGTLDPGASGVLVLCTGKATKLVESIMDQPKVYRATARLDVTSESYDSDRLLLPVEVLSVPTLDAVIEACTKFEGVIQQVPPAISAIKVGGRPAYKLTAKGKPPKLEPRSATIYWLHLHAYDHPAIDFELACGRGTYVRSLIRDLGESLGTGGCLTSLVRKQVGPLIVGDAETYDSLESAGDPNDYLIPLEHARQLLHPDSINIPPRPPDSMV